MPVTTVQVEYAVEKAPTMRRDSETTVLETQPAATGRVVVTRPFSEAGRDQNAPYRPREVDAHRVRINLNPTVAALAASTNESI